MIASNLNIQRAREIAKGSNSPVQQAQAAVGRVITPTEPYVPPVQPTPSTLPPQTETQIFPDRGTPVGYTNGTVGTTNSNGECDGVCPYIPPIVNDRPNPEYVAAIPPLPPPPDPEKTESVVSEIVDEIIHESEVFIQEVETYTQPGPAVIHDQDILVAPPPMTPTEWVLHNEKNCEDSRILPEIIINNEVIVNIENNASGSAIIFDDPPVLVFGCTDPDAMNYDPAATINDFSCQYEPAPEPPDPSGPVVVVDPPAWDPPMPPEVPFLNSHGETLYVVTKDDVKTGKMIKLPSGKKIKATMEFVNYITREQTQVSDLILTEELREIAIKKAAREYLGGELPGDVQTTGTTAIAILNDSLEKTSKKIKRNPRGIIYIETETQPELKISLRSRAFNHDQYSRTIDTEFTKLLGKLEN
jgi:hypothetical protein